MSTGKIFYNLEVLLALTEVPAGGFVLDIQGQKIAIETVLRFLPGKRLVGKATVNGKTVLAKCFLGSSAERHIKRELVGLESFVRAGIDTPEIIATQKLKNFGFITTEFLSESQSLDALWQSDLSDEKRIALLKGVVETVARLHQHNIIHKDPHLDNFLISEDKLFLIDGGGVHQESSPLSQQAALDNLAFFLSVLFPRYDHLSLQCISVYQHIHPLEDPGEQSLAEAIWKKRKWRERYLEKVFRTCTDFVAESNFRHFQVVDRNAVSAAMTDFLATPDTYINAGQVLKRGSTNTVSIVILNDGKKVFVKRYKSTKGFLHKYLRGIRKSRARNAWYVAHYLLRLLGIDTPKPLALLEHKFGCFVHCSYLVTEYVEADDVFKYFTQLQEVSPEAEKRASLLLDMLRILKDAMVYHGDMKASNFMFSHDRYMIIDLDQTVILSSEKKAVKYVKKDSERFNRNWSADSIATQLFRIDGRK